MRLVFITRTNTKHFMSHYFFSQTEKKWKTWWYSLILSLFFGILPSVGQQAPSGTLSGCLLGHGQGVQGVYLVVGVRVAAGQREEGLVCLVGHAIHWTVVIFLVFPSSLFLSYIFWIIFPLRQT